MTRILGILAVLSVLAAPAAAQPDVDARRLFLGASGSTCVWRTGSGAPASGLGSVCDVYQRTDSPYTVYLKVGASTWAELYHAGGTDVAVADGGTGRSSWTTGQLVYASGSTTLDGLAAVATGQVLASAGTGTAPAWSASPTVTNLTASGALQGATVTGTTSVTTPTVTSSANLALAPVGDLILGPTGLDILPDTNYTKNLGSLARKYLTVHAAELWVQTLVAPQTLATIGGRVLVGPTTTLTADLAAAATSMEVRHNSLASGDRVVLEANGHVEWIAVTSAPSGSGPYTYTITRNLDLSGADDWVAGDAVFSTGTTGDGFIDLYSVSGVVPGSTAGPTIVGNVRTGTGYSAIAPRWAVGNLNGIADYATDIYGALFGDPSATHVTVDATNGFRIRTGTTSKFTADTSGNLSIVGDLAVGTAGVIRSGATAYGTGTGYWLDYNGGTPRLRVGTTSGNRLAWDGTDLTLVSDSVTIDANGITIAPATTADDDPTAFKWEVPTGRMGLYAYDINTGSPNRVAAVRSTWTGTGDHQTQAVLSATHDKTSGTYGYGIVIASGYDAGGYVQLSAKDRVLIGGDVSVLDIRTDNATPTDMPYMRSNGNYLAINARSTANGGALYLNNDLNSDLYVGQGGGQSYLYTAHFTSAPPRWATALTQSTVGSAGAASALPSNPVAYIKIADAAGNVYVVPAYNP